MAFWRRIKQSQIHTKLWNQYSTTRSYTLIRSPVTVTADPTRIWPLNSPRLPAGKLQLELPTNVRFFAKKKMKAKPKPKPKVVDEVRPRLNEEITEPVIRLVEDEEGLTHTVMPIHKALALAKELDLDLVEVQRNSNPPVCKIRDYLKDKYKQLTKDKERAKEKSAVSIRQGACKEIRFSAKISQNDLENKVDQAKRLMEQGYRVKCLAIGDSSKESSSKLLSRFSPLFEECAVIESHTRVEDKDQIHVIMRHAKFGPLKKGKAAASNVKSAKETTDADGEEQQKPRTAAVDFPENPGNGRREPSQPLPRFSGGPGQPQFPNGARQPQGPQPHSPLNMKNNRRSGTPDFGIFTPGEKQPGPAQVNRYKPTPVSEPQRGPAAPRPPPVGPPQVNRYQPTPVSEPRRGPAPPRPPPAGPPQVNRYKQATGNEPAQVNRYKQAPVSEPHRGPAPPRPPPVGRDNRSIPNAGSGQERSSYYR